MKENKTCGRLPAPEGTPAAPMRTPWSSRDRQKTVLVIDDDSEQRSILGAIMRTLGCRIVAAPDGRSGLFILNSGMAVDLVVAEYGVPGMTGPELLAVIRRSAPTIPVIFATRCDKVESYIHALANGAAEYLCKPFRPEEITRAVLAAVKGRLAGGRKEREKRVYQLQFCPR